MGMFQKTCSGLKGLISGLGLTLGYFLKPSKIITQQYPENRPKLKLPPRARGQIELVRDEQKGGYICNACGVCVRACPNGSIDVIRSRDPVTKKAVLEKYVYHFERCTLCNLCVDACPSDALAMGSEFENAVYESSQLTMILNKDTAPKTPESQPGPAAVPAQPAAPSPAAPGPATP